jgi:hypothetical protein
MSEASDNVAKKRRDRNRWVRILFALLLIYPLSTGPMTYVVAKLNGGRHTVPPWPLRLFAMAYTPFYRALDYGPKPIFHAWERYDTFFWDLATKS